MLPAFLFCAGLLLIGVVLRLRMGIFRRYYIPAAVIAGTLGLGMTLLGRQYSLRWIDEASQPMAAWPGWLIAVVFAGMLLERKPPPWSESLSRVGRQGLMVWIIVLGQTAVGLLVTWLLIQPFYAVPNSTSMLIETGFAGGHGTAAAMGQVFRHPTINLEGGLDLGILMATCGLIYGVVSGILWINLAARLGLIKMTDGIRLAAAQPNSPSATTPSDLDEQSPIGYAKISSDALDPLLLQVIWLAVALALGLALQYAVGTFAGLFQGDSLSTLQDASSENQNLGNQIDVKKFVESFPLFIYTLFGGWIVRRILSFFEADDLIDRDTINRLTSTAMDVLVVAAITTMNLTAVTTLIVPFSLLFLGGAVWCGVCLMVLSRKLLPEQHWFQLGLINYGMSTGTTATGFVLLRLVDPELESGAAEDYALAAPLSSPFIGGGMLTVGLPLLVLERIPIAISTLSMIGLVALLIGLGWRWNAHYRTTSAQEPIQ